MHTDFAQDPAACITGSCGGGNSIFSNIGTLVLDMQCHIAEDSSHLPHCQYNCKSHIWSHSDNILCCDKLSHVGWCRIVVSPIICKLDCSVSVVNGNLTVLVLLLVLTNMQILTEYFSILISNFHHKMSIHDYNCIKTIFGNSW
jgi:hypothetical protein